LHTNGYSLAQKILFERAGLKVDAPLPGGEGESVADALLAVHRCYLGPVRELLRHDGLHAIVHVTGGGFTDNIPRVLPEGTGAVIDRDSWSPPALFRALARLGPVTRDEMDRTFNMGLGLLLAVAPEAEEEIAAHLRAHGEAPVRCGRLEAGEHRVRYQGATGL
jgi:phosphoribosylformylglycinamidine cyclo-ligase